MRSPFLRKVTRTIEDLTGIPPLVEFGPERSKRGVQTCPVCRGRGSVPGGFYDPPGYSSNTTSMSYREECRSCGGEGVIFA